MERLVFPEKMTLRLQDSSHEPVRLSGVLLGIRIFAKRKNDFFLQPFVTDYEGVAVITKSELMAEAEAHYESGLMDYVAIEETKDIVEICALSTAEIDKAIISRSTVWKNLLEAEKTRWPSIERLVETYRHAANSKVSITPIRIEWALGSSEYDYPLLTRSL